MTTFHFSKVINTFQLAYSMQKDTGNPQFRKSNSFHLMHKIDKIEKDSDETINHVCKNPSKNIS